MVPGSCMSLLKSSNLFYAVNVYYKGQAYTNINDQDMDKILYYVQGFSVL